MIRKFVSLTTVLLSLMLLGAFARTSHAQSSSSICACGGFQFNDATVSVYINTKSTGAGSSGVVSLTTSNAHIWGYVYRIDRISATESHIFAHAYGQNATLEIDVFKSASNWIGFYETNNVSGLPMIGTGKNTDGSLLYLPFGGVLNIK